MSSKAVIITGAARRVGAAMARHFAHHGYDIALHYHHSHSEAKQLQTEIEALGVTCALFSQDMSDISSLPTLMRNIRQAMPHCVALVNNASIFERASFLDTDEALFDRQMNINLKAPFFLTQAFATTFTKGCTVNILDTDIVQTQGSHFAYLLSKKMLAEFTVMAARALGPDIRVNGVCPGYVLPHSGEDAEYIERVKKDLPLHEHATLGEITEAVLWLCLQKHITGQILYVDGGKHVL